MLPPKNKNFCSFHKLKTIGIFILHFPKLIFQLLVSLLVSIFILIPIFSIVFGLNEIRRFFVSIYFKVKTGSQIEVCNGGDGAYTGSGIIIRVLSVFKSNYDFESFKQGVIERITNAKKPNGEFEHKKLRSLFQSEAGYTCWKFDKTFNPNNHFRVLPEEENMSEERLMEIIQELSQPLPKDRPEWEMIFIPKLPNPMECGVIFRIHHSHGDGLSIFNALAETLSHDKPFPYVINPVTYRPPFWLKLGLIIKGYSYFGWTLVQGILNPPKISEDRHPDADSSVIHNTRFSLSLTQLKSIQKKTDKISISAIILTAMQTALDKVNKGRLGLNSYAIVAKVPYPKGQFCNRTTALNAIVPGKKGQDWPSQLAIVNNMTNVSSNLTFFVNDTMNRLLGRMPANVMKQIHEKVRGVLLVSNLPFVTRPVTLGDGVITDCFVWPSLFQSIFVSSLTIGDKVNVTFGAGANILTKEELELVVEEFKTELNRFAYTEYIDNEMCIV